MAQRSISSERESSSFYWSTIAYARWWLGTDASILAMIKENGGLLDLQAVSSISIPYNIARGLPKRNDDHRNSILLDVLNQRSSQWPEPLLERAAHCAETVRTLRCVNCLRNDQASAVSKFMWFLNPDSWTMFDRYAADGMGTPPGASSTDRLMRFYQSLHDAGFDDLNRRIGIEVKSSNWRSIPPARIIDTFLMRRGGQIEGPFSTNALSAFLNALPEQASLSLHDLGMTVMKTAGHNPL